MSYNSESGLFATIERLWRTLVASFWIFLLFFIPALALAGIGRAYRRRRAASSKYERRYWSNEIVQCWCILYLAAVIYFHLFQDLLPGSFDVHAKIVDLVDTVMGLPGLIWYIYTDRAVARSGDSSQFLFVTFWAILILLFITLLVDYMKVFGSMGMDGLWEAPDHVNKKRIAEREKRDAPIRALSAEWFDLQRAHPRNHDAWAELSAEQREKVTAKWDAKKEDLFERLEQCNAARMADQSK